MSESIPSTAPSSKIIIREAIASDAAAIAEIGTETFRTSFGWSMPTDHCEEYLRTTYTAPVIAKEIGNEIENQFFVAELRTSTNAAPQIGGFVQMKLGTTEPCIPTSIPQCELHRIYVSKNHLGAGIGGHLIQRGIQWAQSQVSKIQAASLEHDADIESPEKREREGKRAALWLGVWQENEKAHRFYARYGFVNKMGTHDFKMGDTTQTDDILLKWL